MTRGTRVRWAPERSDSPTASASSWIDRLDDLLGGLVEPGVDDLEPGVAQRPGDHLGAAVVPVEPGLGHDHSIGSFHGRRY